MALAVGTQDKKKVYIAAGLGALALLLVVRTLFIFFGGPSAPPSQPAEPIASAPTAAAPSGAATPSAHEAVKLPSGSSLDPTLHPEVMAQAEDTAYTGNGRNIFSPNSAAPVPIEKPVASVRPGPVGPPQPPPPPAIDLKFYGYSSSNGGHRRIFLLHNDDIFIASEGDVVDRRYKVVAIRPFSVEVEDIPYHNTQSLPLTQN
ncbi:MAG: hypothetical protein ACR2JE_11590 [Acidobacteriaceae bacterium]